MSWLLIGLLGCGTTHRMRRVIVPVTTVSVPPTGELSSVSVVDRHGEAVPYSVEDADGLARPVLITKKQQIYIEPGHNKSLTARFYVRNFGVAPRDTFEIHTVTGARPGTLSQEVRFLPDVITRPVTLAMADLTNTYNGYRIADDDLLLVELSDGTTVERYAFQNRKVGFDARLSYGLLVRSTLPTDEQAIDLSPALTAGLAMTWRRADRGEELTRALDSNELIVSLGLGTSSLEALQGEGEVTDKIDTVRATGLVGGGVILFQSVSVQLLTSISLEPQPSLALGIDTVRLAVLTRDVLKRLTQDNALSEPVDTLRASPQNR
ncbi:MAG: hypothetical protein ACI8RZ_002170 [Myxococcota bacterium]|jgi:hypothetical protein